jgi:hypothetical protein
MVIILLRRDHLDEPISLLWRLLGRRTPRFRLEEGKQRSVQEMPRDSGLHSCVLKARGQAQAHYLSILYWRGCPRR